MWSSVVFTQLTVWNVLNLIEYLHIHWGIHTKFSSELNFEDSFLPASLFHSSIVLSVAAPPSELWERERERETHTHVQTHERTHTHTRTYKYTHTHTHTHTQTQTQKNTRMHTHTYTYSYTYTYTHKHIHIHTHTHNILSQRAVWIERRRVNSQKSARYHTWYTKTLYNSFLRNPFEFYADEQCESRDDMKILKSQLRNHCT